MTDAKGQFLVVVTFTALFAVMAYNLRPQYCIKSSLVGEIELSRTNKESEQILSCDRKERAPHSEDLVALKAVVKDRLEPLESYLNWNFQHSHSPVKIKVMGSQRKVYQVQEGQVIISPDQIMSGGLERGVFKLWLRSELGIDSSLPSLLQESLVDLFLHAAGYDSLASSYEKIQKAEESWQIYPSSAKNYCESDFRLPEHLSLCEAVTKEGTTAGLEELLSNLSLRPLHSLILIEAFVQLSTREQLTFGKEILKSLSYTAIFGWNGSDTESFVTEAELSEPMGLSIQLEQWLQALSEGNPKITTFSEIARQSLERRVGQHADGRYLKLDMIYFAGDVSAEEGLTEELARVQALHPAKRMAVVFGDEIRLGLSGVKIPLHRIRIRADYVITVSCDFPKSYESLRELASSKWLAVRRCGKTAVDLQPLAHLDTESFAVLNPNLSFVQFDLGALEAAFGRNIPRIKEALKQSEWSLGEKLREALNLFDEEESRAGSLRARSSVPGVDWYRL